MSDLSLGLIIHFHPLSTKMVGMLVRDSKMLVQKDGEGCPCGVSSGHKVRGAIYLNLSFHVGLT